MGPTSSRGQSPALRSRFGNTQHPREDQHDGSRNLFSGVLTPATSPTPPLTKQQPQGEAELRAHSTRKLRPRAHCGPATAPQPGSVSQVMSKRCLNGQGGVNSAEEKKDRVGKGRGCSAQVWPGMDGPLPPPRPPPHPRRGNEIIPTPTPTSAGLAFSGPHAGFDPSMTGATIKGGMGSERSEEREGSSVAAKHPPS